MKAIILLLYIVGSYLLVPYLFHKVGAIRKIVEMSRDELNERDEIDEMTVQEEEWVKKIGMTFFVIISGFLFSFLGITFGLVSKEIFSNYMIRGVSYPILYLVMISSFRMGRKSIEDSYEMKLYNRERVFFYLVILISYLLAIWYEELVPSFLKWHWIY